MVFADGFCLLEICFSYLGEDDYIMSTITPYLCFFDLFSVKPQINTDLHGLGQKLVKICGNPWQKQEIALSAYFC